MGIQSSGEQPSPEVSPFSIDLERLTVPEIVFFSGAVSRRIPSFNKQEYPNMAAWGFFDDQVHEYAQRNPERGRAIYEGFSRCEDPADRSWFLATCLQRYVSLDPDASAYGVWERLVTDRDDNLRNTARHKLSVAFTDQENVTTDRLYELGLNLHEAGRLLVTIVQNDQRLLGEQDQV
jgi:hypothetical protein